MIDRPDAETPVSDAAQQGKRASEPSGITEQTLDKLSELAALSWSVSSIYSEQVKLTGQTAKAEWQLSGRSLTIAAALLVCFGAGLILLWSSILLLLGYGLWQLTASLPVTVAAMLLLQFGLLIWCWRSLSFVLSQIGFSQTLQQLRRVFFQQPDKDTTARETTSKDGESHAG